MYIINRGRDNVVSSFALVVSAGISKFICFRIRKSF